MAQYTTLSIEDIKTLAAQYAIGDINSYKVLSGGSENTNYLVTSTSGVFVLTICEQKTLQEAKELTGLLEYLGRHQFNTSKVIRSKDDKCVIFWHDKPVLIKEYIHGHIIKDLSPSLLSLVGKELGKLHKIQAPEYIPKTINYGISHFDEVKSYAPNSSFDKWLEEIKIRIEKHTASNLPKALVHSDLFYSNVIIGDNYNSVTVMDFEEASYYYRVFDIGMTIVGLCSQKETIDLEKSGHLLSAYQEEIQLSEPEIDCLKDFTAYAAAGTAFWRHKHFNYILPDATMADHYLTMKNIADHVTGLPDDCFKKLLKI